MVVITTPPYMGSGGFGYRCLKSRIKGVLMMIEKEALEKLEVKLNSMKGGLVKSERHKLTREPPENQLVTVNELYELAKQTGDIDLVNIFKGMKGGLTYSANSQTGRDKAGWQLSTVERALKRIKEIKETL